MLPTLGTTKCRRAKFSYIKQWRRNHTNNEGKRVVPLKMCDSFKKYVVPLDNVWLHILHVSILFTYAVMSATVSVELQLESDTLVSWPLIGQVLEFPNLGHAHFSCNELSDWTRKRVLSTASAHRVLQGQTLSSMIHTFFLQYKTLWFALWIITSRWLPMGVNIATSIFNIRKISIDMC